MNDELRCPVVREAVSLYEPESHLAALVERVVAGEEVVISKSRKPKARLVPLGERPPGADPGQDRGQWRLAEDFDAPLPPEVLADFGGDER